jgi:hypothetical protein
MTDHKSTPYKMPEAKEGQFISFYPTMDRKTPHFAMVVEVGIKKLVCVTLSDHRQHRSVAHFDDPKLVGNPHWAQFGSWDYTEDSKAELAYREKLDARLAKIEADNAAILASLQQPVEHASGKSAIPREETLDELRTKLASFDVEVDKKWNPQTLKKKLRDIEDATAPSDELELVGSTNPE